MTIDVPENMTKDEYILSLEMETFDLIAKIVAILKDEDLWDDADTYTFRDGDRWSKFDPEVEDEYYNYTKEENVDYG